jgi:hypothetical protein
LAGRWGARCELAADAELADGESGETDEGSQEKELLHG